MKKDRSSLLAFIIAVPLVLCLLLSNASGAKLYVGGEKYEQDAGILFRSIGYRGVPLDGVPFHDDWGIIPNENGRIMQDDKFVQQLYTAGWIKRGPSGIIGTNKACANETIEYL